jgi:hypothetical protein
MDVVYICRNGDNEELRYSIRSVVANFPYDKIWVVGGKPDWYCGNHIPVPQDQDKYSNARANMKAIAASDSPISNNFILMNDDFFILSPIKSVPYYYGGTLYSKIESLKKKYRRSSYITMLSKSYRFLRRKGIKDPLDYTLHIPFKMNKNKLRSIIDTGISWRLAYGNLYSVGGTRVDIIDGVNRDVKVYMQNNKLSDIPANSIASTFLSSEDKSFQYLRDRLNEMFPEPSEFELI